MLHLRYRSVSADLFCWSMNPGSKSFPPMADIFISFAREDIRVTEKLAAEFEAHGWSVWWDQHIPPGKTWAEVIGRQLTAAKCAVVLWSRSSVNSAWVRKEARNAEERQILIPAIIDDVEIPWDFKDIQTADLKSWVNEGSADSLRSLIDSITALLQSPDIDAAKLASTNAPKAAAADVLPAPPLRRKGKWPPWVLAGVAALVAAAIGGVYLYVQPEPEPVTPLCAAARPREGSDVHVVVREVRLLVETDKGLAMANADKLRAGTLVRVMRLDRQRSLYQLEVDDNNDTYAPSHALCPTAFQRSESTALFAYNLYRGKPTGEDKSATKAAVPEPGFPCEKAATSQELIICSDLDLTRVDADLGAVYRVLFVRIGQPIKREQNSWVKKRDQLCACDYTELANKERIDAVRLCLLGATSDRLGILRQMAANQP